ncbi:MAG: adenylate cyclase [Halieaceae bacterium]
MVATPPRFRIGELEIHPESNQVVSDTETRKLPRQSMDVLVYLVEHRDRVVPASELLDKLWADRVVEESTIHRVISQIRTALGDSAQEQRYIRTISKRGYQVIADVAAVADRDLHALHDGEADDPPVTTQSKRIGLFAALVVMCLIVSAALLLREGAIPREVVSAELQSVAVLPFDDLTPDQTVAHVAAGMTEELLTRLSEIDALSVSSRADATRLNSENMLLADLAQRLKVAYVVEGSVQADDQRTRITAQLIRAADGFHVWSVDYDVSADLTSQARLAQSIAHRFSVRVQEDIRRNHTHLFAEFDGVDPQAVAFYLDAEEEFNGYSLGESGDPAHALQLMESAAQIDPSFEAALLQLAWNYAHRVDPAITAEEGSRRAHRALARILEKDPDSADGLFYQAQVYLLLDLDYARAKENIIRGMQAFPEGRWWNYYLSRIAYREGRLQDALRLLERSVSRDFGEERSSFLNSYATALCDMGAYQRAIEVTSDNIAVTEGGIPRAAALLLQSWAHIGLGNQEAALPLIEEAWQIAGNYIPGAFGYPFAMTGQQDRAFDTMATSPVAGLRGHMATGYLALGDKDKAFALLAEGIETRDSSVLELIRTSPRLSALRGDPRYAMLLERLASMETLSE